MDNRRCCTGLVTACLMLTLTSLSQAEEGKDEIAAVEFLGTVDCYWHPEAQKAVIQSLLSDPREPVRYAAAGALREQLQRGKPPLEPLYGWRNVPDPLIATQIARLGTFQKPLTAEQLMDRYSERKFQQEQKKGASRGDTDRGNCNEEVTAALSKVAFKQDDAGCYYEPSERIRQHVEKTLLLCVDRMVKGAPRPAPVEPPEPGEPPKPGEPPTPDTPAPDVAQPPPDAQVTADDFAYSELLPRSYGNISFIPGRADTANRFNFFDNMGAEPNSRAYCAYQSVVGQNNAIFVTGQNEELFSILGTESGRRAFISFTGFGSGYGNTNSGGDLAVDPTDPNSAQELEDLYLAFNTGRTRAFTVAPDTNLYRFGFEYALTMDFSVAMQAQYVTPLGDVEQPDMFSNPLIQLKHVFYRADGTTLSGIFGIQPQIPHPEFAIVEKTSRVLPGLLAYHAIDEDQKWFIQGGTGFNLPTVSSNIKTWDYVLGLGHWLYRHDSVMSRSKPPANKLLLGIIPEVDVIGKHIIGKNEVTGIFDLSAQPPQTADGTRSPVDGTRTIYLPQDPSRSVDQVGMIFTEPRHVVDLTFALTLLFRNDIHVTTGLSVPVTGGAARELEFIASFNYGF